MSSLTLGDIVSCLAAGQTYEFVQPFWTPAGWFERGERLELVEATSANPYEYTTRKINNRVVPNWLVKAKNGNTVWCSIPALIELGWVKEIK